MSKKIIDIGTQSTANHLEDKIGKAIGVCCNPSVNKFTGGNTISVGAITGGNYSSVAINYKDNLYVLVDNGSILYRMTNDKNCWRAEIQTPYPIDIHETCILSYNNPVTDKYEIHILGGSDYRVRAHYKWDGKTWSVASELPYDFSAGKAIVYNGEIHIFGGGSNHYQPFVQSGFLNYHYKWDGADWIKLSEPSNNLCGATPVVYDNNIWLIGGIDSSTNKNVYRYNGSSWSSMSSIPSNCSGVINPSVEVYNNTIHVVGGVDTSGTRQYIHLIYSGSWSQKESIPNDALCDSSNGLTIYDNRLWLVGYRAYYLTSDIKWVAYKGLEFTIDNGIVVNFESPNGEVLGLFTNNELKEIEPFNSIDINHRASFNTSTASYVKNSSGDIHIVANTSTGSTKHYWYTKEISDNSISYVFSTVNETLPKYLTNPKIGIINNTLHIIGKSEIGYNHYTLNRNGWLPINTTPFSTDKYDIISFNNTIYSVSVDDTIISLYKYNGHSWVLLNSIDISTKVISISIVVYQNKVHIIYIDDEFSLQYLVYTGSKFCEYKGVTKTSFLEMRAITHNGYIYILASNDIKTEQYCIQYDIEDKNTLSVYLPVGHQIICNKNDLVPIVGIVEETSSGYKSLDSGVYKFISMVEDPEYSIV